MAYSVYDSAIAVTQSLLRTLSHILHTAEQSPNASTILESRLIEDMYPVPDQVRLATQYSEFLVARLMGREPVTFSGNPTTFAECYQRIDTVLQSLSEADRDVVTQHGDAVAPTNLGPQGTVEMSGAAYAHTVVLPNIYFHLNTAYGILRKAGIPLGKKDYYVGFFPSLNNQ
ncbi:hypothetical protein N7462_011613 [Penicillium macrosclerotiorum]|uniref:uncharacterized protein n=1 Tax=Penicillium macrosclerotiorum TaxID=303699 RepID=UPI002549A076|nr:uncharacterized protein N7462_011613 [Penicillium macrosclerotiorum]KAJ5662687.1 hypothetical protein N7462_011613 [Penicillium macrosclerotiorum]